MDFPGLLGPFYTAFSTKAEVESCKNFRLEKIESGAGRNQYAMYKQYGLKVFGSVTDSPFAGKSVCRGLLLDPTNVHLFTIFDDTLYDVLEDGTLNPATVPLGPMVNDGLICSMDESAAAVAGGVGAGMTGGTLESRTFSPQPVRSRIMARKGSK